MIIARQLSSLRNSIQRTKAFEVHPTITITITITITATATTTAKLSFFVLSLSFSE